MAPDRRHLANYGLAHAQGREVEGGGALRAALRDGGHDPGVLCELQLSNAQVVSRSQQNPAAVAITDLLQGAHSGRYP